MFEIEGTIFFLATVFRSFMSTIASYWQIFLNFKPEMFFLIKN